MNFLQKRNRLRDLEKELMIVRGKEVREFGMDMYTLLNSMDRGAWWAALHGVAKSQTLLNDCACTHTHTHTHKTRTCIEHESCSMLYGRLVGRRVWGRMDACICIAESLWCPPETVTTLLIGYTLKLFLQICFNGSF